MFHSCVGINDQEFLKANAHAPEFLKINHRHPKISITRGSLKL